MEVLDKHTLPKRNLSGNMAKKIAIRQDTGLSIPTTSRHCNGKVGKMEAWVARQFKARHIRPLFIFGLLFDLSYSCAVYQDSLHNGLFFFEAVFLGRQSEI